MTVIYIDHPNVTKFSNSVAGEITESIKTYIASADPDKIAFTGKLYFDGSLYIPSVYVEFVEYIRKLSAISKKVFVVDGEYTNYHHSLIDQFDNVYWLLPGLTASPRVICWAEWLWSTDNLYKNLPDKLGLLTYAVEKPKYFDALMGLSKPHRRTVYRKIQESGLNNKIVVSLQHKTDFVYPPNVKMIENTGISSDKTEYFGNTVNLSQVIPTDIYNQTAYSIITESYDDSRYSHFTEKIAKVILARRLFIVFTGYKYLENLKKLGFKTFDNVIDESYDQIMSPVTRYNRAFEQVKYLCSIDQNAVYKNIHDTVTYNYNLITSVDWIKFTNDKIKEIL